MRYRHTTIQQGLSKGLLMFVMWLPLVAMADHMSMMGGHGGMGMMGGHGYGGMGMMGGHGYGGMGMMGGHGYGGMGMMGFDMLDLNDKQREKIRDIMRAQQKSHYDDMDKMMEQRQRMHKLMTKEKRDAKAIVAAMEPMFDMQRKRVKSMVETMNKIDAVLTKEQRENWRKYSRYSDDK